MHRRQRPLVVGRAAIRPERGAAFVGRRFFGREELLAGERAGPFERCQRSIVPDALEVRSTVGRAWHDLGPLGVIRDEGGDLSPGRGEKGDEYERARDEGRIRHEHLASGAECSTVHVLPQVWIRLDGPYAMR